MQDASGGKGVDPHVHRQRVQTAVRQARIDAGRTQPEVAAALDWSLSKIVRIESGTVRISSTDLRALLGYYGITDPTRVSQLVAEAREARRPGSWADYEPLLGRDFTAYLGFEGSATRLRQYQAGLVPGLLQTEPYARAVLGAVCEQEHIDELVEVRRRRQQRLDRPDQRFVFILDEGSLRRRIGGDAVMADQLRHLAVLSARPNIAVLVLRFEVGEHAGLAGSFILLEVGDDDVVYLEDSEGGLLRRDDRLVTGRYAARFQQLEVVAEPAEQLLSKLIKEIEQNVEGSRGPR